MSRLFSKVTSRLTSSGDDDSPPSAKGEGNSTKRREQVRRAQKTHRERRAKYLLGLEAEVAHLRTRDAQNIVELRKLNVINTRLIALLTENNILIPRELEIVDDALITTGIELLDATGGSHNLRATSSTGSSVSQVPSPAETVDLSDPQVAINFVLALEKPCLDHFHLAHGEDGETGHIFMLQASMLETGPSKVSSHLGQSLPTDSRWDVPRQQLDQQLERLVSTARQLNLNGELTPVMCWFKLRERLHGNTVSSDKLDRIRNELFPHVACFGYGAVMDARAFNAVMSKVL